MEKLLPISSDIALYKQNMLASLSPHEGRVYLFLVQQLGNKRVPRCVPYLKIAKACGLSYKQARSQMDKLIKKGLIQKWSEIHQGDQGRNSFKTSNFYRLRF